MKLGMEKCGVVIMERRKFAKGDGIKVTNGETVTEVDKEGCKYLEVQSNM